MNELQTLARMAKQIGVTKRWLREQADLGTVPHLKAGRRYLFNMAAVQTALSEEAAKSNGGAK